MADAEQVSSTTLNEVAEEEHKPGHWSETGVFSEATMYENAGLEDGDQDVEQVQKAFGAVAATGGAPFTLEPEVESRLEEEMEMELHAENKADTEWLEKSNLISEQVPEPDSTHLEYALREEKEEALLDLGEFTQKQEVAEPEELEQEYSAYVEEKELIQVQEPVISSYTELEEDFRSFVQEEVVTHEEEHVVSSHVEDFSPDVIQEQMISTTRAAQEKEEIFDSFDLRGSLEQKIAVSSSVSEQEPVRSVLEEPEEKWNADVEPVVEETFRSAPVEAHSAPPASSSSHEPSPLSSAAAVPLPTVMQFSSVVELLYWRDVKNSGIVFGACLLLLLSLSMCSIISVLSYVALALLSVTISFRIYKGVLQAIQKSDEGHPFKLYLEQEVALPEDIVHKYSESVLSRINAAIIELRRLFLVEDLVDSLKFAVLMWILTYVGALFNGLTLLILGLVGAFTCPVVYEKHQVQIDHYIALVNNQVKDIAGKIQAKIPGAKKKAE